MKGDHSPMNTAYDPKYDSVPLSAGAVGYQPTSHQNIAELNRAIQTQACQARYPLAGDVVPAEQDLQDILKARGERYGAFIDNATIAQLLKNALRQGKNYITLAMDQKEALDQIATKVSRIVTGDVTYVDNWEDIAGYAQCVSKRMKG